MLERLQREAHLPFPPTFPTGAAGGRQRLTPSWHCWMHPGANACLFAHVMSKPPVGRLVTAPSLLPDGSSLAHLSTSRPLPCQLSQAVSCGTHMGLVPSPAAITDPALLWFSSGPPQRASPPCLQVWTQGADTQGQVPPELCSQRARQCQQHDFGAQKELADL